MKKFPLDLSKFKKVKSDKHSSVLKHADGHELTIAHGRLKPELKQALDRLPMATEKVQKFDSGGDVHANSEATPDNPLGTDSALSSVPSGVLPGPAQSPAALPQNPGMPEPAPVEAPAQVASPEIKQAQDPFGNIAAAEARMGALDEQKRGQQLEAQAKGDLGIAQSGVEKQFADKAQHIQTIYNEANAAILKERTALQDEIAKQKINPRQYIDQMSTGGKIATGIGLILGGMGAGLTHGPNMAFQFLQDQINRDIDAQKAELGKKQNLLTHNYQATQDLRSASDMTRLHTNDILASHLRQEADKAQSAAVKGMFLDIAGKFDDQSAQIQHSLSMQRVMMNDMNDAGDPEHGFRSKMTYLRVNGQEALAKDMEAKHVPGVGQASKEVPPDVMKEMIARQDLHNKITDLQSFAAQNSGSLSPATIAEGKAKAALVQDAYRRANAQGVFKEAEKDFVGSIVSSNPTQFFEKYRAGKGYQEMGRDNLSSLDNLKKGYGLPPTPQAAAAPQIKIVGGVKYMRGPNGEAIPVQ